MVLKKKKKSGEYSMIQRTILRVGKILYLDDLKQLSHGNRRLPSSRLPTNSPLTMSCQYVGKSFSFLRPEEKLALQPRRRRKDSRDRTFSARSRHGALGVASDSDVVLMGQGGSGAATTASCAHISF